LIDQLGKRLICKTCTVSSSPITTD